MTYTKTVWEDLPSTNTPINATNLNNIESGVYTNDTNIGDLSNLNTTDKSNLVGAINEINDKLLDTGWKILTITNNNWENFFWEPLAYRRIGEVCYIHGAGKLSNISSLSSRIICNLPYKPRQNLMSPQAINNSGQTATMFVNYSKTLEFMGTSDNRNDAEILINISYPISY